MATGYPVTVPGEEAALPRQGTVNARGDEQESSQAGLVGRACNKGAPGVDGMKANQSKGYLKRHWPKIKQDLLNGAYRPLPVRRKEIDKPDGGVRLLGIPIPSCDVKGRQSRD